MYTCTVINTNNALNNTSKSFKAAGNLLSVCKTIICANGQSHTGRMSLSKVLL